MMRKFKGDRTLKEIENNLKKFGFIPDYTAFDEGGDWVYFIGGKIANKNIDMICYGIFGRFKVIHNHKVIAQHTTEELDNEEWYNKLLEAVYLPLE